MMKQFIRNKKILTLLLVLFMGGVSFSLLSFNDRDYEIAKHMDIFFNLFQEINSLYVDEKDPKDLFDSSIEGMLESLDPYTTYIPESDMDDFNFMITGEYGGIGALIRKAGEYTIISEPYEGFPAHRAGLSAGDTLIAIDGISTKGKTVSDVSDLLKGSPNTKLNISLKREADSILNKQFLREKITIPNVPYYSIIEGDIGYIRLSSFTIDASKEVRKAFTELKNQGAKSLILDLRNNPGGSLSESVDIANIWIGKDKEIVSTHGKAKQWDHVYTTSKPAMDTLIPLAVLVNRGSASASEIVAGSLQDLDRAIIVGQRTFGKGLVQTTRSLGYKSRVKVTTAKYYIPSGRCIQALDYTHRNDDGSVGHVPDSLISEYKTKNGRSVFDGGGIQPDIDVSIDAPANITISLYARSLLFDYATIFARKYKSILPPEEFEITDEIYGEFIEFLADKDFEYNTLSNDQLDELIKTTKREGYYKLAEKEIESLRAKLAADVEKDLITFKEEIKDLLRDELVSRYYYQKGRIVANLKNDPQFKKAIEVLNDQNTVNAILHGVYEGSDIKLAIESK